MTGKPARWSNWNGTVFLCQQWNTVLVSVLLLIKKIFKIVEVDVKLPNCFLGFFFVFQLPPRGPTFYPINPNDPRNKKYMAILFICHLLKHFVMENG